MSKQVQPIFILPEGTQRNRGKGAQSNNIAAAKEVADTVRTTLGPKGMDKMIVDSMGNITVTNDGVTILEEMRVDHPAARMVIEVARTQENEIGDGTTTAVVIAGELLKKAEGLLEQNIHPTIIIKGYRVALNKTIAILNELSENISSDDDDILVKVAETAMTGKGADNSKSHLSKIVVEAVKKIADFKGKEKSFDKDFIKIEKRVGETIDDTVLVDGIVLDKEKVHPSMPKQVNDAKILLLDSPIEVKEGDIDTKIQITDPEKMEQFLALEERMLRTMVDKIVANNVNVVFCQKGIDDLAQHFLAKKGIFAVRRVTRSDLEKISRATGANLVNNVNEISDQDIGTADIVSEKKVGEDNMIFVEGCDSAKAVTILVRGATEHVVDEIYRAIDDAIGDVASVVMSSKVVGGAGAVEVELAMRLFQFANTFSGKEQLAIKSFADALEVIPKTLAENAGLDPINVIADLRSSHEKKHKWAGIDVFTGKVIDSWEEGVIEPLKIKTQAINSASEVAVMLLRVDDVILSAPPNKQAQQGEYFA